MGTYYVQAAASGGTANWIAGFPLSALAVSLPIGALIRVERDVRRVPGDGCF